MQFIDQYHMPPGSCVFCKQSQRILEGNQPERILDTLTQAWDPEEGLNGRIYICETCITDWAAKLGWVSSGTALMRAEEHEEVLAELAELKARNEELEAWRVAIAAAVTVIDKETVQ